MNKLIMNCNKQCNFYEEQGCCHNKSVTDSPEERIISNDKFKLRKFTEEDNTFKKFNDGFPEWCPLEKQIND